MSVSGWDWLSVSMGADETGQECLCEHVGLVKMSARIVGIVPASVYQVRVATENVHPLKWIS